MLHNKISKLVKISLISGFFLFASSGVFAQANSNSGSFLLEDGDRIEDVDPGYLEAQARHKAELLEQQKAETAHKNKAVVKDEGPTEGPKETAKVSEGIAPSDDDETPNIH